LDLSKSPLFAKLPANLSLTAKGRVNLRRGVLLHRAAPHGRRYPLSSRSSSGQDALGQSLGALRQAIAVSHGYAEDHGDGYEAGPVGAPASRRTGALGFTPLHRRPPPHSRAIQCLAVQRREFLHIYERENHQIVDFRYFVVLARLMPINKKTYAGRLSVKLVVGLLDGPPLPWSTCAPLWVIVSLLCWLIIEVAARGIEAM